MRGVGVRGALAIAFACACVRLAAACSSDYAGTDGPAIANDASDATNDVPAVVEAASDAAVCPPRYMPAEGTYAYATVFSIDYLVVADAKVDTQPFDNPYFATVTHEGAACFRFSVDFANGPKGHHDHSWKFCNTCNRAQPSLDVVEETDDFQVTAIGTDQSSHYECTPPNPYLVTDVAPDAASIPQGACLGESTGTKKTVVQVLANAYVYEGAFQEPYQDEDASMAVHRFRRESKTIVASGDPQIDTSSYGFDVDSGLPSVFLLRTSTKTKVEGIDVSYTLTLVGRRSNSAVSPLLNDR